MDPRNDIQGARVCTFADIEILRYKVDGFEELSLRRKLLIYHLSEAALVGRDITFDQNGRYNLRLRHLLEQVYQHYDGNRSVEAWLALEEYLYRLWFSSGIHHHYGAEKFAPSFSQEFLHSIVAMLQTRGILLDYDRGTLEELYAVIFDPNIQPKRTEQTGDNDLVKASAVNYYTEGVQQNDVEALYRELALWDTEHQAEPPSYGLNSRIGITQDGELYEQTYSTKGLYRQALLYICQHLEQAKKYTDTETQRTAIGALQTYYQTGDLNEYNRFCILWVQDTDVEVDFINGFTEAYNDPLGFKGSWEGIVHIRHHEASQRTQRICQEAGWFEANAPIDERFKKSNPIGVNATVVTVAMLAGDTYPATPIGINLPNADWIRAKYGSKSITINNIHEAYRLAYRSSGMDEAFVPDAKVRQLLERYDGLTDQLHTDLHECLGHGSGQLLPNVSSDALGAHHSTIEETRADLFALYYMGDKRMIELGLLPDDEAYKACYYRYILAGAITQLVRIAPNNSIEEAHMRNRALIARYALDRGAIDGTLELRGLELIINDYERLRSYFADLLREVQRIKSEGDAEAARSLIERWAISVDPKLHSEILARYRKLNLKPYCGFVNPRMHLIQHDDGTAKDVILDYTEGYAEQMLRYSSTYGILPLDPVAEASMLSPQPSAQTLEIAKALRKSLRGGMDGIVSTSMREKGLRYGINFGLTMEHIHQRASTLPRSKDLACYLLSRDVRELQLIGQLIFPSEELSFTEATYLACRSVENPELRDCLAKHLFDRVESAPMWSMAWLFDERYSSITSIAYITLARHFTKGFLLQDTDIRSRLMEQVFVLLGSAKNTQLTHEQRAALLLLKRWGRSDHTIASAIRSSKIFANWQNAELPILREFYADISFELEYPIASKLGSQ